MIEAQNYIELFNRTEGDPVAEEVMQLSDPEAGGEGTSLDSDGESEVFGDLSDIGSWTKGEYTWSTGQLEEIQDARDKLENLQDLLDLEDAGVEVEWPEGQSAMRARELIAGGLLPPRYKASVSNVTQDPQIANSEPVLDDSVPVQKWHFNAQGIWTREEDVTHAFSGNSRELSYPPPIARRTPKARGSTIRGRFAFGKVSAEEARLQTERDRRSS